MYIILLSLLWLLCAGVIKDITRLWPLFTMAAVLARHGARQLRGEVTKCKLQRRCQTGYGTLRVPCAAGVDERPVTILWIGSPFAPTWCVGVCQVIDQTALRLVSLPKELSLRRAFEKIMNRCAAVGYNSIAVSPWGEQSAKTIPSLVKGTGSLTLR